MPPFIIVGVIVILDKALSIEANLGLSASCSLMISSTLSDDGLCSMANVERCSNRLVEVSLSASYSSILLRTVESL